MTTTHDGSKGSASFQPGIRFLEDSKLDILATPAENRERERRREQIVKAFKKIVRGLGDGLTVPIGNPKP